MIAIEPKEYVFEDGMPGVTKQVTILLQDAEGQAVGRAKIYAGFLDEVWVRPDCRGQGLGTRLVKSAISRGARKAIAIAAEIRSVLTHQGWITNDGRRFTMPAV